MLNPIFSYGSHCSDCNSEMLCWWKKCNHQINKSIVHCVLLHFQQKSIQSFQSLELVPALPSFSFHGPSPSLYGADNCIPALNASWSSALLVQICLKLPKELKLNRASLKDAVLYHFSFTWLSTNRGVIIQRDSTHPKWIQTTRLKASICILYITLLCFCLLVCLLELVAWWRQF